MAWIESHTVLIRHRKLIELAKDLRVRPVHALGHLHVLWHAALEQAEEGDLSSWTDDFIAESACWPGGAPQFVRLLQKHGWLDGKLLHDWLDYAGMYLIKKYSTSNVDRLKKIWKKHGLSYGRKTYKANNKRLESDPKESLPNLTTPNQPKNTPPTPPLGDLWQRFLIFWKKYPKKRSKGQAKKVWKKLQLQGDDLTKMLHAIEIAKRSDGWLKESGKFIPYPATWLNAKGWEDVIPEKELTHEETPARDRVNHPQNQERWAFTPPPGNVKKLIVDAAKAMPEVK